MKRIENSRYYELDSLRGIAALIVVIFHCWVLLDVPLKIKSNIWYTPFAFLISGHQSVIVFFLLSGFVLALPFLRGVKVNYYKFMIKRLCRIYIPYLFAIIVGITCRYLFNQNVLPGHWSGSLNLAVYLNHLVLISSFSQNYFVPVIWSLVHEMRISILFPLIMFLVINLNWRINLLIGALSSLIGITLLRFDSGADMFTNYYDTFHYIFIFIMGALVAKHKEDLIHIFNKFKHNILFVILNFVVYVFGYKYISYYGGALPSKVSDWLTAFAGVVFIIAILGKQSWGNVLRKKIFTYLGQISYSIYLFHILILITLINVFHNKLHDSIIFILTIILTLIVSSLTYFIVERPSIRLGKILTSKKQKATNRSPSLIEMGNEG
ncbi:acyltransferase [Paenibacillus filicis]|uniref:Acyltransferase n=1 Tax=Paenibacillus gyeongsangnamensis TaxID=3388067 RepID=A0ABT4QHY2_9BACL|nr:acyltransferase [Paenibacillus filicis]MCZ8516496.1 acyltransferase [Paenibacillus filicis]